MEKINFKDLPSTETPINAENLNQMQDNIEDAIGEIVGSGSNDYGSYVKFADGTMICRRTITKIINCSTAWGSLYYGSDDTEYNYAQSFIEPPEVSIDVVPNSGVGFFQGCYERTNIGANTWSGYSIMRPTSANDVIVKVFVVAIGKWK